MLSPTGVSLVFNGEIYNFRTLRRMCPTYRFRTKCDTEVLLALFEEHGIECLKYLNGMFAFAVWDPRDKTLRLVRDRIGQKPLYYAQRDGMLAFSSEIKPLFLSKLIRPALDHKAVYDFLTFGLVPPPRTLFDGVSKLPPGWLLTVQQDGQTTLSQYWDVEYRQVPNNEDELCEAISASLKSSIQHRTISDVPVGTFLSGGVDSSAITALLRDKLSYKVNTFSIGFADQQKYDELDAAAFVAKRFDTAHHQRVVSSQDIANLLPRVVSIFDDPLADPTCIPIYFLAEMAKNNGVKVVLNGDGPDELFLGYNSWRKYAMMFPWYRRYCKLPTLLKRTTALCADPFVPSAFAELLHRASRSEEFFWGGARGYKESTKRQFLSSKFRNTVADSNSHSLVESLRTQFSIRTQIPDCLARDDVDWMSYVGLKHLIPNFYTHRADRLCMAHSVEARSPFLDYNFVNLSLSIPHRWKLKNGVPKYILKRALSAVVPSETLNRRKMGFCVPLQVWGREIMASSIRNHLPTFCSRHGIFRQDVVLQQVESLQRGAKCNTSALWTTCYLLLWANSWLN